MRAKYAPTISLNLSIAEFPLIMSGPRLSTVYDFASLRLHPDGSRVNQTSRNFHPRHARVSAQDARGNWFARDAAGSGVVGRYKKVRDEKEGEQDDLGGVRPSRTSKRKGKEIAGRRRNLRPAKRHKFLHDLDFLESPSLTTPTDQPLPSSDLLKCIHYFASTYYHERGQLFNASKEYRQMRKQNKLRRIAQAQAVRDSEEPEEETVIVKPRRGGRIKGIGKKIYPKDMYKVMEGSALMAIGMVLQESVARLLEVRIPDGWENSVQRAFADSEDDDDPYNGHGEVSSDEDEDVPDEEDDEESPGEGTEEDEDSQGEDEDSQDKPEDSEVELGREAEDDIGYTPYRDQQDEDEAAVEAELEEYFATDSD